jgi:hypothetical protein
VSAGVDQTSAGAQEQDQGGLPGPRRPGRLAPVRRHGPAPAAPSARRLALHLERLPGIGRANPPTSILADAAEGTPGASGRAGGPGRGGGGRPAPAGAPRGDPAAGAAAVARPARPGRRGRLRAPRRRDLPPPAGARRGRSAPAPGRGTRPKCGTAPGPPPSVARPEAAGSQRPRPTPAVPWRFSLPLQTRLSDLFSRHGVLSTTHSN